MAGVRVHHKSEINCIFTLVSSRPYVVPFECSQCHTTHTFKTYHIELDGEGFAIVSPEVWEKLQQIPVQPFELSNEVKNPPPRTLSLGFNRGARILGTDGKEIRSGNS